jgi:hypothetical protein
MAGVLSAVLLTTLSLASGMFLDSYATGIKGQNLSLDHHMVRTRIAESIAEASEVQVISESSISVTFPAGGTESYSWSGTPGDPAYLAIDGGNAIVLADGVTILSFSPELKNGFEETTDVMSGEIVSFETFGGSCRAWEDLAIGSDDLHGLCFEAAADERVGRVVLTSVSVRLARLAGQINHLHISLREGFSEEEPRPWGIDLAVHVVNNIDIPAASYLPGGGVEIGWTTIPLPEVFEIQPNRFYCLLFGSESGGGEAGTLRVDTIVSGTGPSNGMSYLGSGDGGASWNPALDAVEFSLKDVPVHLDGDFHITTAVPFVYVDSVDLTLGMELGDKNLQRSCRARVRGAGER